MNSTNYRMVMQGAAVMLGLAGTIAVHVLDLQGKMEEVPYLGFAYIGAIIASGVLLVLIATRPSREVFLACSALSAAILGGFIVKRTVGLPNAMDDIGNWFEPLGMLSVVCEVFVLVMGLVAARTFGQASSSDERSAGKRVRVSA